jgi:hypothetical protein
VIPTQALIFEIIAGGIFKQGACENSIPQALSIRLGFLPAAKSMLLI